MKTFEEIDAQVNAKLDQLIAQAHEARERLGEAFKAGFGGERLTELSLQLTDAETAADWAATVRYELAEHKNDLRATLKFSNHNLEHQLMRGPLETTSALDRLKDARAWAVRRDLHLLVTGYLRSYRFTEKKLETVE